MVIAFSTDEKNGLESRISHHFGKCPYYVFVKIENGEIKDVVSEDNPYASSHGPGVVPDFIASKGANIMVSGGMGPRAVEAFERHGIKTIIGLNGIVKDVLKDVMDNKYESVTSETYDIRKHDRYKED